MKQKVVDTLEQGLYDLQFRDINFFSVSENGQFSE